MSEALDLVLGIDGGGTKTVAWLARVASNDAEPEVIGRGKSGPSNVRAIGIDQATTNLNVAIDNAFSDAQFQRTTVANACLGLAGAGREADRASIEHWATENAIANRVQVVHDALPVIYAANERGIGISLISGTGSLAFGRDHSGATARCGGWGYLLGDEGSGYAIAVAGLRAAARAADNRGPKTSLPDQFLTQLELSQPQELVSTIYSPDYDRAKIASLSDCVFCAANESDSVATTIIQEAANDLAELVLATSSKLEFADALITVALTGGVLANRPEFRELLVDALKRDECKFTTTIVSEPVLGAVRLASVSHSLQNGERS